MVADTSDTARARFLVAALAPERATRIVDIGASPLSPPPYDGLRAAGLCEVWGFEPQPEQFDKLVAEARPNEHYLPNAVGDGGSHELRITAGPGLTSLFEPHRGNIAGLGHFIHMSQVRERVALTTARLDDLADLPQFDLLKIDIQGGEAMVFEHGGAKLGTALAVITEVAAIQLYEGQPLLDDQMRLLRGFGFSLHKFLHLIRQKLATEATKRLKTRGNRSQLVDGDAVFVRGLLDRDSLTDEQAKHLAILADAVFTSFDLAVALVEMLEARGAVAAGTLEAYLGWFGDAAEQAEI